MQVHNSLQLHAKTSTSNGSWHSFLLLNAGGQANLSNFKHSVLDRTYASREELSGVMWVQLRPDLAKKARDALPLRPEWVSFTHMHARPRTKHQFTTQCWGQLLLTSYNVSPRSPLHRRPRKQKGGSPCIVFFTCVSWKRDPGS